MCGIIATSLMVEIANDDADWEGGWKVKGTGCGRSRIASSRFANRECVCVIQRIVSFSGVCLLLCLSGEVLQRRRTAAAATCPVSACGA